jgi:hypothetical protein
MVKLLSALLKVHHEGLGVVYDIVQVSDSGSVKAGRA